MTKQAAPNQGGERQYREHLVSVETQREFDLFSGEWAERVFVKLYVAARTSGLLAEISDRDWKTLCTLATYMDGDGYCFPSQAELARAMGCSRQMANERVKSLAEFRFQEQPVLLVVKSDRQGSGKWARNGYRVLGLSSLSMYDETDSVGIDTSNDSADAPGPTVSTFLDTVSANHPTVSSHTVTVGLDTNKNHRVKPEFDNDSNIRMALTSSGVATTTTADRSQSPKIPGGDPETTAAPEVVPLAEAIALWQARRSAPEPVTRPDHQRRHNAPRRRRQEDPGYQVIQGIVRDIAIEFHDRAPLSATTTRAFNLWRRSGIELDAFADRLYAARAIVKERTGAIRSIGAENAAGFRVKHGMGYFFAVLEDVNGLRRSDDGTDQADS